MTPKPSRDWGGRGQTSGDWTGLSPPPSSRRKNRSPPLPCGGCVVMLLTLGRRALSRSSGDTPARGGRPTRFFRPCPLTSRGPDFPWSDRPRPLHASVLTPLRADMLGVGRVQIQSSASVASIAFCVAGFSLSRALSPSSGRSFPCSKPSQPDTPRARARGAIPFSAAALRLIAPPEPRTERRWPDREAQCGFGSHLAGLRDRGPGFPPPGGLGPITGAGGPRQTFNRRI